MKTKKKKFFGKKSKQTKSAFKSRKEIRKDERRLKKQKKHEFFQRKRNSDVSRPSENTEVSHKQRIKPTIKGNEMLNKSITDEMKRLKKDMQKERVKQLKMANEEEDMHIKRLEKDLKLKKRKRKTLPKSFVADGLDCIL